MEFADVVRSRRMCRRYDPEREVDDSTLAHLLALAGRAPSAGFSQGRDFVVLRERQSRDDFWAISTAAGPRRGGTWLDGMRTAPVVILCLSDPLRYLERYARPDKGRADQDQGSWPVPYWDVDTGMAALILLLAAEDAGLGACFFGLERGREAALGQRFAVPDGHRFTGVVSLGHRPAQDGGRVDATTATRTKAHSGGSRPRPRQVSDYVHAERFGTAWPGHGYQSSGPDADRRLDDRIHET